MLLPLSELFRLAALPPEELHLLLETDSKLRHSILEIGEQLERDPQKIRIFYLGKYAETEGEKMN